MKKWDLENLGRKYEAQRVTFATLVEYLKALHIPSLEVGEFVGNKVHVGLLGQSYILAHTIRIPSKVIRDEATGCITRYLLNPFNPCDAQKKFQIALDEYGNIFVPSVRGPEESDHYRVSESRDLEDLFGVLFDLSKD